MVVSLEPPPRLHSGPTEKVSEFIALPEPPCGLHPGPISKGNEFITIQTLSCIGQSYTLC